MSFAQRIGRVTALAVVLAAGGCATNQYLFVPTENATATTEGYPAARYPVPPESPRGTVYVASFGVVSADVAHHGPQTPMLEVRMTVSNDSGAGPWTVDTREQLLEIPGAGPSRAAAMNSDQQGGPVLTVPPGQKRTLDLYYPLPPSMPTADKLAPSFDLMWRVQTPERLVAQRTPFDKQRIEPAAQPMYADVGLGWGPYWWYDPFYPGLAFYPTPLILHPAHPVHVHGRPHPVTNISSWHGHPVHR